MRHLPATLDPAFPQRAFCDACIKRRDALRKQSLQPGFTAYDRDALAALRAAVDALAAAFPSAYASIQRGRSVRKEDLEVFFVAAKEVIDKNGRLHDRTSEDRLPVVARPVRPPSR